MKKRTDDEHAYLKQLLEHSPDGVFTIDMELHIRYVNPAFCKLLGYSAEQLRGSLITDYLVDMDILGICMASVESTGHCNDQETIFKRADGAEVHISKNVQAIYDDRQQIPELLVTIRDMTELHTLNRQLEESLREREQANTVLQETLDTLRNTRDYLVQSEKMAALGSLVAGMAHEINTPIGVSVTSASSIHEDTLQIVKALESGDIRRSQLEQYLQHMQKISEILLSNLNRAAELTGSFKQVAVDQSSDEWREIRLNDYIDEILRSLQPKLKPYRLEIEKNCDPDLVLFTHPGGIYQILSNLVINAITHAFDAGKGGKLTINAHRVGDRLLMMFGDNGKGIPAEHIDRIFEPFFTTRRGQGGSGLGLNILYNLVTRSLNGQVRVDSTPGQGTTFWLDFPMINRGKKDEQFQGA